MSQPRRPASSGSSGTTNRRPEALFSTQDLRASLEQQAIRVRAAVDDYPANELLVQAEDDLVAYLVDEYRTNAPVLRPDEKAIAHSGEEAVDVSHRFDYAVSDRSRPAHIPGVRVEVAVPFDGDAALFKMRAATWSTAPPSAVVLDDEVRLIYQGVTLDSEQLRHSISSDVAKLEQWLQWVHELTDPFDAGLPDLVRRLVQDRKNRLLAAQDTVTALGLPVRERPGAPTFSIPATRRKVVVKAPRPAPATGAFVPEPILATEHFERAMDILAHSRNMLERLPRTAAGLSEEGIRDILLVNLNSSFEGRAGGELFNGAGKTDILIREDDRNVFVGECKIWKGPAAFGAAVDQLLGYVVWRDCKAVLLLFIRTKDVTAVITKAVGVISAHPRCKRSVGGDESRHDFVFHADGDPNREIHLALLPFALRA